MAVETDVLKKYEFILFYGYVACSKEKYKYFVLFKTIASSLLAYACYTYITSAVKVNDPGVVADDLIAFLHCMLQVLMVSCYWFKREIIYKFLEEMTKGGFNYKVPLSKEEMDLTTKIGMYEKYQRDIAKYWTLAFVTGGLSYSFLKPLLNILFQKNSSGASSDIVYSLPIAVDYGNPDSWPHYFLIFLAQSTASLVVSMQGAVIGLLFGIGPLFVCLECEKLVAYFGSLEKRSLLQYLEYYGAESTTDEIKRDPKFLDILVDNLKECIQHHQQLKKIWRFYQEFSELLVLLMGTVLAFIVAVLATQLFEVEGIGNTLVFTGIGSIEAMVLFITSMGPQEVFSASEKLSGVIFYTNWYNYPEKYQKMVKIVLTNAQPLELKCLGVTVDLNYFTGVLNSTYSYINLLLAFK